MTHAQRIMERMKLPRMDGTDVYQFGLADENARLLPIIQALLADSERMANELESYRYSGRDHNNNKVVAVLDAHTQTLKELAGDV